MHLKMHMIVLTYVSMLDYISLVLVVACSHGDFFFLSDCFSVDTWIGRNIFISKRGIKLMV